MSGALNSPLPPGPLTGVTPATAPDQAQRARRAQPLQGPAFGEVLTRKLEDTGQLRFSGHALERLRRRGIELDETSLSRLADGVERAASKGSRDSLVLVDGTAFVVSVANRTVITAVGREHMKEQVFTNIDSAVIA
ncbi:MAG: TIGR02530 family flagellar biosynthesis protein [Thermoleophilia bacterium]